MSRTTLSVLSIALSLACAGAGAGDYSGTFVSSVGGEAITMTLEPSEGGAVRGSLDDGVSTLALTGQQEALAIHGLASGADGTRLSFLATFGDGGQVHLQLAPVDEAGNPVNEFAQTLVFAKRGGGGGGTPTAPATAQAAADSEQTAGGRQVYINRVKLDSAVVTAAETQYRTTIQDGRYWYDSACGAWGVEGGPTAGFLMAGLDLPGPMPVDISGGGTGIFINGREIHVLDQQALANLFGDTIPGSYWLDAMGNLGPVGGAAIANLATAIQRSQQGSGSVTHGYGSAGGARGTVGGGMYSGRTATGKSVFWYPGM